MHWHAENIAYVERRTTEGLSEKEIIRCLKRYVARELFGLLPPPSTLHVSNSGLNNPLTDIEASTPWQRP